MTTDKDQYIADACVFLMNLPDEKYRVFLVGEESKTGTFDPPVINIGVGYDVTIRELAMTAKPVTDHTGKITFDSSGLDSTPGKLLDVSRLSGPGWRAGTQLGTGLSATYTTWQEEAC